MGKLSTEYFVARSKVESLKERLSRWEWTEERLGNLFKHNVTHTGHSDWGESGVCWWLFPAGMSDEEINEALVKLDIIEDTDRGVWDDNDWDCSGKTLVYHPSIKRTKTRVLVTQSWAIDV